MRPQRNAGENPSLQDHGRGRPYASMRPQRNAGENAAVKVASWSLGIGFNEAPAKCRGKLAASRIRSLPVVRFNEAPAKCRGKPG